ncbi:UDP-N-acetylmuramoyl-L-alanine--D-glutamate ligase [Desulfurispora thermophila]|uniref:UDP-N-acetylmuramoyl-L-alanine--D-glutamate ligase n=1 Tax=Desulfurispora thermophila TaxID=265470 RepID=UPI000368074F|nr:UDP-N-acetylmuramoyl-L-alanine--D-glutamate ligase [Desulfurispora thermophila]
MNWQEQNILVIGAGRSGQAAARFLLRHGAMVTLADKNIQPPGPPALQELQQKGARLVLGAYPPVAGSDFTLVVTSPGVPLSEPPLQEAQQSGLPLWGELELAWQVTGAPVVAVTGTNGKTTTTTLLGEMSRAAGYRTLVAGNIGLPLVDEVENYGPGDLIVAEVSSFQLETIHTFRPRVGLVLNLTPDHLDRHGSMENYAAAKARITMNQGPEDFLVLNYDDPWTRAMAGNTRARVIFFSRRHNLEQGVFVQDGRMVAALPGGRQEIMPVSQIRLPGLHNLENALAAVAAMLALGVPAGTLAGVLRTFPGVPHRLESVAEINGVLYVNDSKGTNPDASSKAVAAYDRPLVLILGGRNKGNDFVPLLQQAAPKLRALVVVGECRREIIQAARTVGIDPVYEAGDYRQVVELARRAAQPGDVVLLSPACASWDMFRNFEERGECFKQLVRDLL